MRTYSDRLDALEAWAKDLKASFRINKPTAVPAKPSNTMPFSTQLTPAQLERLNILAEECAEVIKCVMKINRHGFESINPHKPADGTNRQQLECECADLQAALTLMISARDIDGETVGKMVTPAITRKLAFCHFQ